MVKLMPTNDSKKQDSKKHDTTNEPERRSGQAEQPRDATGRFEEEGKESQAGKGGAKEGAHKGSSEKERAGSGQGGRQGQSAKEGASPEGERGKASGSEASANKAQDADGSREGKSRMQNEGGKRP